MRGMSFRKGVEALVKNWEWRFCKRKPAMKYQRRWELNRGCVDKVRFNTWVEAKKAVPTNWIYLCEFCGGYHHTSTWPKR
jgi:hypothetical protein